MEKLLILHTVAFMPGPSKRKLVSNSYATFNLKTVNLLSSSNVNLKNGIAYKQNVYIVDLRQFHGILVSFLKNTVHN